MHSFIFLSLYFQRTLWWTWYYVVCITIILCNNVSFYRYRVSQEDGSMPCDRPVNVLLYLLFYNCAKLHLLLLCHWRIKFILLLLLPGWEDSPSLCRLLGRWTRVDPKVFHSCFLAGKIVPLNAVSWVPWWWTQVGPRSFNFCFQDANGYSYGWRYGQG